KEHVLDYLPEQYKNANMDIRQAVKNNDVVLDGLTIFNPNGNMSPTIYLNSAYEEYQQGMDIEEVVGKIADAYIEHIEPREEYRFNFDLQEVKNYEVVKDFIYPKVSNLQSNVNRLSNIPYTQKEDLAITYHIWANGNEESMGSITINNDLMEMYGIDMGTLHEQAMNNMDKISPVKFESLQETMVGMLASDFAREEGISIDEAKDLIRGSIPNDGPDVYCVSNESRANGAVYIMREDVQQMVAEKLGGDYYVLPSSIHETLILPKREDMSFQKLQTMVQDVNAMCVSEEEVLSDGVYQYDAKSHTFSRCDKTPELTYKQAEEKTDTMDLTPGFAMAENKQEYKATLPKQTHEPMKHKGH
ncbi:MAG: DUF5688 family protein, partial [Clostridiales bacterium]|nr:DUF5688 family protein [Clostridiales bacterium]